MLCTPISRPIASRARHWRALSVSGTRCANRISAVATPVAPLRTATAVITSAPLSKARRAATWFAAITRATTTRVANPKRVSARA